VTDIRDALLELADHRCYSTRQTVQVQLALLARVNGNIFPDYYNTKFIKRHNAVKRLQRRIQHIGRIIGREACRTRKNQWPETAEPTIKVEMQKLSNGAFTIKCTVASTLEDNEPTKRLKSC